MSTAVSRIWTFSSSIPFDCQMATPSPSHARYSSQPHYSPASSIRQRMDVPSAAFRSTSPAHPPFYPKPATEVAPYITHDTNFSVDSRYVNKRDFIDMSRHTSPRFSPSSTRSSQDVVYDVSMEAITPRNSSFIDFKRFAPRKFVAASIQIFIRASLNTVSF